MKKILISGDSWGCGEWQFDETNTNTVVHRGLEQYFLDDEFCVVNCSAGRSSNADSIQRIFEQSEHAEFDLIIWFQTDPLRDLRPYNDFLLKFTRYEQLLAESKKLLNSSYTRLNQLEQTVVCIGGCSKLDPDIANYNNLIPLIASVPEFLLDNYQHPQIWHSDWIRCTKNARPTELNEELLDQLLADKRQQDHLFLEPLFNPDGQHPNRQAHRILYNFIQDTVLNEKIY